MAHINALVRNPPGDVRGYFFGAMWRRRVTPLEGWQLYDTVIARLRDEALQKDWPPLWTIRNIRVNCPVQRLPDGEPLTGAYILQALRDFLDMPNMKMSGDEAFIVNHWSDERISQLFDGRSFDRRQGHPPQNFASRHLVLPEPAESWRFMVHRDRKLLTEGGCERLKAVLLWCECTDYTRSLAARSIPRRPMLTMKLKCL